MRRPRSLRPASRRCQPDVPLRAGELGEPVRDVLVLLAQKDGPRGRPAVTSVPSAENTCANSAATKPPPTITIWRGQLVDAA